MTWGGSVGYDVVIRNGLVVDGTGAPPRPADVAIEGDRIAAVGEVDPAATVARTVDAQGRLVTPGFVDIHTHLDAQLAWDPVASSSCYHGVTTVVLGNCGVTFAPCRPEDRAYLAEMMESVEDIPAASIMSGLPWDWHTYGEYLSSLERMPKGVNVGGMVGHCAVRYHAMGERSLDEAPATPDDVAAMCDLVDEAMAGGALGFSTSRTLLHRVPDGRPVPGTFAAADELLAVGDVLGRHGRGVFEAAARLGERDDESLANTRAEVAWMGELSVRSGRPVTFGLTQSDRRPELYRRVIEMAEEQNARGARLRPQTTSRGVGILFGLAHRTPFERSAAWRELRTLSLAGRLAELRRADRRAALVAAADAEATGLDFERIHVITGPDARYDHGGHDSLAAVASARNLTPAGAFVEVSLETEGRALFNYPFLNQRLDAVSEMLCNRTVVMGLADAGAHVGQIMDASQPTFFLTYWVREKGLLAIEDAIRRLTSDTAELFGVRDRGVLRPGAFADVNVIDFDGLRLPPPEYVHDFPGGAGRYVQRAAGYDHTFVNGQEFMRAGEPTGRLVGTLVRA